MEEIYFPHIEAWLGPSTVKGDRDIWKKHISSRLNSLRVYEFRTIDDQRLLDQITKARPGLSRKSMLRIKALIVELFGDGEFMQALPATIEVLPRALPVFVPVTSSPRAG